MINNTPGQRLAYINKRHRYVCMHIYIYMELQQIVTISYEFANAIKQLLSNYYQLSTPRKRFSLSDYKKTAVI